MQAFANHKAKQYEEARDAAERYIEYYPSDEDSAYAQYIIALSYYDQIEDIECLAHLMKTCGRLLDHVKAKTRMDQYFDRIRAIINNPEIPTRIKFLLQDVIEMRKNRWMPRKLATPDGPRTIQQVREDAARDGCIYLPQQDLEPRKPSVQPQSQLQQAIFNKGHSHHVARLGN